MRNRNATIVRKANRSVIENLENRVMLSFSQLDATFAGGLVTTNFSNFSDKANGVAVQSDGKTVVVGSDSGDISVARYNVNGTLDTSFHQTGKVTYAFTGDSGNLHFTSTAYAVGIQGDGKIVVAGEVTTGAPEMAVLRFNTNGSVDSTFHFNPDTATFHSTGDNSDVAYSLLIQSDGKIVVAGESRDHATNSGDFAAMRLKTDGTLDTTFAGDGTTFIHMAGGSADATTIVRRSTGQYVLAGTISGPSINNIGTAALTSTGALDTSYGSGTGKFTKVFHDPPTGDPEDSILASAALQSNGELVVGFTMTSPITGTNFGLARVATNGTLDAGFGAGGITRTNYGGFETSAATAGAVAVASNDVIAVVGTADMDRPSTDDNDGVVLSYTAKGVLSTEVNFNYHSTGSGGTFAGSDDEFTAAAFGKDGKLTVAGYTSSGSTPDNFALARVLGVGDVVAPTAALSSAPSVSVAGGTSYTFKVTYTDNVSVKASTIGAGDIRVTGPNGFTQVATFVSVDSTANGPTRVATYKITTPGGKWDHADNGTYSVTMIASQVSDTVGHFVVAGLLGHFTVTVP